MANPKMQKVITPENLGQGIAYNPQTKKWEVHFASEAEIEQVPNYTPPEEDDEHYLEIASITLRDRTSGYMWGARKVTQKNRAPARNEDATITASIYSSAGRYFVTPSTIVSNIDGVDLRNNGSFEYLNDDLGERFKTTKEYNDYVKDKKIKFVTTKRFADTIEGKPMIRSTTLEASYPVMEDHVEERTWRFTGADGYLDIDSSDSRIWYDVYGSGKLTIKLITQESGKQPVETDITNSIDLSQSPNRIAYGHNGVNNPNAANIKIQFVPSTVKIEKLGYTFTANFENFDNGVVVETPQKPSPQMPEGISNVRWRDNFLAVENYHHAGDNVSPVLLYHTDHNNKDNEFTMNLAQFANSKEANEHYKDKGVEVPLDDSKNATIPWINLPYIDTEISLDPLKRANRGANSGFWNALEPSYADGTTDDEKHVIQKALKEEARSINVNVRVIDPDSGSEVFAFTQTPGTFRMGIDFRNNRQFVDYYRGANKELKLVISSDPITINWWSGKVTINFKTYEAIWGTNGIGRFE